MIQEMKLAERLVSLGRAARENANIKVRQPLASAEFVTRTTEEAVVIKRLTGLIQSELNVKAVGVLNGAADVVTYALNPLPSMLGKKFGSDFPVVQKALREGTKESVTSWAKTLLAGQNVTVDVNGRSFEVTPQEVEVKQGSSEGFAIATEGGYLAAVDIRLTEDLIMEGFAREVVRRIQAMRKDADYNVDDTITIRYVASERLGKAIVKFGSYIQDETLGVALEAVAPSAEFFKQDFTDSKESTKLDGETLVLGVRVTKA
jgi:isoleucyl-tRNA synthetase